MSDPLTPYVCDVPPLPPGPACNTTGQPRKQCARTYRRTEADRACGRDLTPVKNRNNGEERDLVVPGTPTPTYAGNYTKGMRHDDLGEVSPRSDYQALLAAVNTETVAAFEAIPTAFPTEPPGPNEPRRPTGRRYVDPQAGIAYDLEGPDAAAAGVYTADLSTRYVRNAPRFADDEFAAEMAELYWMALLRDTPVNRFAGATSTDADVQAAADNLSRFADFRGPNGPTISPQDPPPRVVTPQLLFRGGNVNGTPGDNGRATGETVGPYLSQFLLIGSRVEEAAGLTDQFSAQRIIPPGSSTDLRLTRDQGLVTYGTVVIDQRQHEIAAQQACGSPFSRLVPLDFMTEYVEWLQIQRGATPSPDPTDPTPEVNVFTGRRRFLYSPRQLANYVHFDQTYQEYLIAALLLLSMQERAERTGQTLFGAGNPYLPTASKNQEGFATFGNGHVLALLAEATTRALKAAWNGKWFNQRRLRPETAAGRIHNTVTERVTRDRYGISRDLLDTAHGRAVLDRVFEHNRAINAACHDAEGTYLLPQAYPEGSPLHPSYPAGHATQAGACVTILKAFFNEDFRITDPSPTNEPADVEDFALEPNDDGTALRIYHGPDAGQALTVRGELNKLAANVSLGRNIAGVHYRIDYAESVQLGEYVALGILQEQARSYNQAVASIADPPPFFFELTLLNGTRVRVLRDGALVAA